MIKMCHNISNRYMRTKTRYVLLGLLSQKSQTGYDLKKHIDENFKAFWNESYGQIYPELKKLLKEGHIKVDDKQKDSRRNTVYSITKSGQKVLQSWLEIEPEKESVRLEILLKTYFSNFGNKEFIIDYLEGFKESHDVDLRRLKAFKDSMHPSDQRELIRILDFGIKINKAYVQWCEESLYEFKKEVSL